MSPKPSHVDSCYILRFHTSSVLACRVHAMDTGPMWRRVQFSVPTMKREKDIEHSVPPTWQSSHILESPIFSHIALGLCMSHAKTTSVPSLRILDRVPRNRTLHCGCSTKCVCVVCVCKTIACMECVVHVHNSACLLHTSTYQSQPVRPRQGDVWTCALLHAAFMQACVGCDGSAGPIFSDRLCVRL